MKDILRIFETFVREVEGQGHTRWSNSKMIKQ